MAFALVMTIKGITIIVEAITDVVNILNKLPNIAAVFRFLLRLNGK